MHTLSKGNSAKVNVRGRNELGSLILLSDPIMIMLSAHLNLLAIMEIKYFILIISYFISCNVLIFKTKFELINQKKNYLWSLEYRILSNLRW